MIDPQTLAYFRDQLTPIDYAIVILGSVLLVLLALIRLTNGGKAYFRRADKDLLNIRRTEIQLQIVSSLIETLPYLGILGTVWGLMNAMFVIQTQPDPTIKLIAAKLAPALSSTFLGLLFAIVNGFVFNFLAAYIQELSAAYSLYYERATTPTVELERGDTGRRTATKSRPRSETRLTASGS